MVDVSVIVVNYNGAELLDDCFASVLGQIGGHTPGNLEVEVIAVDNASTDDSLDQIERGWGADPRVRLIALPSNGGFAAGNNAGFRASRGRYLLLLNSDARMRTGALERMVEYLDTHPGCGQVGPKLLNTDGSLQRSARGFPSPWNLATEYWYIRKLLPRSRWANDFYKGWFDHQTVLDNDGFLMGACLLIRKVDLDRVGAMDESYFMFNEETDWARRFLDAGLTVTFLPSAECVHLGGGSTCKEWSRMYQSQIEGNLRYLMYHSSEREARRAQRVIGWGLAMRALLYRCLGLVPGENQATRRARGAMFATAGRHVRSVQLSELGPPQIPSLEQSTTEITIDGTDE